MAESDLVSALITVWVNDLVDHRPAVASEARGMLALARLDPPPLLIGAAKQLGMDPAAILDAIERRANYAKASKDKTVKRHFARGVRLAG